jgi:hypothetical protein
MSNTIAILDGKIEVLGSTANAEQGENLAAWIVDNVDQSLWPSVMGSVMHIEGVYCELSMRCGEVGL